MNKPKLIMMIGLSASGKSTMAKFISSEIGAVIVSSDDIRGELGNVSDQSNNTKVFEIFHSRIKENLLNGISVIADATNITIKLRKAILDCIKCIGCYKEAYIMSKEYEGCLRDNVNRNHPAPINVIARQRDKFPLPFYEEGFDKITIDFENDLYDKSKYYFINECIDKMLGFDQNNPHHNQTLLSHCNTVLEKFVKKYESDYTIRYALRLHDIGKLFSKTTDESGISHYYNHENVGTYYLLSHTNDILNSTYLNTDEIIEMLFYVNYHMMVYNWNNDKIKDKWKRIFGDEKFNNLIRIHECDMYRGDK